MELRLSPTLVAEMLDHARAELPNECVGMLAGRGDGVVVRCYPLVNALASPTRFESEPRSLLAAEKARRAERLEFLAVYHSHPTSNAIPSQRDAEQRWGNEVLTVIISLQSSEPEIRAWRWDGSKFVEASLKVASATSCDG